MLKKIIPTIILFSWYAISFAQTLQVRNDILEDTYRRAQLSGDLDSAVSFTVRPLFPGYNLRRADKQVLSGLLVDTISSSKFDRVHFSILPAGVIQQYNSHPLYQWNDGAMINARGYQGLASAGFFAKYGPFSIQLNPEYVFAENAPFEQQPLHYGSGDLPTRFGKKAYTKLFWGQSSFRLTFSPVSIGISNENLWWGPGNRNSLLMSNNAPGFKHLTLNTTSPVKTLIGSFEGQIIAARLDGSGFNQTLPHDWRYLSGMVFSYSPKWTPGLFLGLTRSFQIYQKDMDGSFGDLFPLFQAFQKKNTDEDSSPRDQITSLFARWLMPGPRAELYIEYGLNDHSYNTRDFLMAPEHSRAYILGMRKLVPFNRTDREFLYISAEITHTEQSIDGIIRDAGEWYMHSAVVHGYTHKGQVLGAGIGPGGNHQLLDISWVKGLKRFGIQLERYVHNGDLAKFRRASPWVDISMAAIGNWSHGNMLFNAKLQGINSVNYFWSDGLNGRPKRNGFFVNGQIGLVYTFNKKNER